MVACIWLELVSLAENYIFVDIRFCLFDLILYVPVNNLSVMLEG